MTRVLVVYHDVNVADIETDELRRAGFDIDRCAGPIGGSPCPVLHGMPCWQVEEADVLLYDTWESGPYDPDMVASLRAYHGGKPIVLTSSRAELEDIRADEANLIFHAPARADLIPTIRRASEAAARHPARATIGAAEARSPTSYHVKSW